MAQNRFKGTGERASPPTKYRLRYSCSNSNSKHVELMMVSDVLNAQEALAAAEVLYEGVVPCCIRANDREDRQADLTFHISVMWQQSHKQRVLTYRLTEEADPFFLDTLEISEEDFQALKSEQSLLVDFATFPKKVIELLQLCATATESTPKYMACLMVSGLGGCLNLVEINQFKQLTHLSLQFRSGDDAAVKKHLANRIGDFKSEAARLTCELESTHTQLLTRSRLAADATSELQQLSSAQECSAAQARAGFAAELVGAKEIAIEAAAEAEASHRAQIVQLEASYSSRIHTLDLELNNLRKNRIELTEGKFGVEAALQGTMNRLEVAEVELGQLRGRKAELDDWNNTLETEMQAQRVQLAVLTQQVQDHKSSQDERTALVDSANATRLRADDSIGAFKQRCEQQAQSIQAAAAEINRGNEIIALLQNELRSARTKLKSKALVLQQQEVAMQHKATAVGQLERELEASKQQLKEAAAENTRLHRAQQAAQGQLDEQQEQLSSNKQVIGWLNKEVNEVQMRRAGYTSAPSGRRPQLITPTMSRPSANRSSSSARVSQARAATALLLNTSSAAVAKPLAKSFVIASDNKENMVENTDLSKYLQPTP